MPSEENNPARLKLALAIEGIATDGAGRAGDSLELVIVDDEWARVRGDESSRMRLRELLHETVRAKAREDRRAAESAASGED